MFKRLREKLEAALAAATPPPDLGEIAARMREAVIEQKAGLRVIRDELGKTEQALAADREQLATAERRRDLARQIEDAETAEVAERFAARHRDRVAVLERKVEAQRAELALAERDLAEMMAQLKDAGRRIPDLPSTRGLTADLETDLDDSHLRTQMDRAAREAAAAQKLDELKRKMGRG